MKELRDFLDNAKSSYHAVALLQERLRSQGYQPVTQTQTWDLQPGGKYYLVRGGSSLIAFRVPQCQPEGFAISAAHCDRPTFKVKENGTLTGTYTRLATEKYGGMLMGTWLDRPLSVAGRVMVETQKGVESRLVDIDKDLLLIPNVAIHMNRKANEGQTWNAAVDTVALMGGKDPSQQFEQLLQTEAGGKILGHDLYLYVRQKASVWGLEEDYISAAALDDLACVWCCAEGFLAAQDSSMIPLLCIFDSEEVGSCSAQGAGSTLLAEVISRISAALHADENCLLNRSFMLSADNAHAVHPNHPEFSDEKNAPVLNGGIVLKFNANLRYTTDGATAAVFRKICSKAEVPVQTYYNRADAAGGSTLGCISLGQVSVPCADIGLPQLAMHSCYETAGVQDVRYMQKAMKVYFESTLEPKADGSWTVR